MNLEEGRRRQNESIRDVRVENNLLGKFERQMEERKNQVAARNHIGRSIVYGADSLNFGI